MQLYLVQLICPETGEKFHKIGITSIGVNQRFSFGETKIKDSDLPFDDKIRKILERKRYISDTPYDFKKIHTVLYNYDIDAQIAEQALLKMVKKYQYRPLKKMSGLSECFKGEEILYDLIKYMDDNSSEKNKNSPSELHYKLHSLDVKERDPIKRHLAILERCKSKK